MGRAEPSCLRPPATRLDGCLRCRDRITVAGTGLDGIQTRRSFADRTVTPGGAAGDNGPAARALQAEHRRRARHARGARATSAATAGDEAGDDGPAARALQA